MPGAMRLRHQHRQVGADHFLGRVAEDPLGARAPLQDAPALVDRHDCVDHGVENGLQARAAFLGFLLQGLPPLHLGLQNAGELGLAPRDGCDQRHAGDEDGDQRDHHRHRRRRQPCGLVGGGRIGKEDRGPHGGVVHAGHRQSHDRRGDHGRHRGGRLIAAQLEPGRERDEGQRHRHDDGDADQTGIEPHHRFRPHRRHAGIVHGADAGAHEDGAHEQAADAGVVDPSDHVERHAAREDSRHHGCQGAQRIVGDSARQGERQHADEVHSPDAAAHAAGTRTGPGPPGLPVLCGSHAGRDRERDKCCQDGNEHRHRDQPRVIVPAVRIHVVDHPEDVEELHCRPRRISAIGGKHRRNR